MAGNNHINFTKKTIEELPAPNRNTRLYFHDTKQPGLSIYVTKSGARTFFVRNKANGADDRIVLGRYPDLSIENARKVNKFLSHWFRRKLTRIKQNDVYKEFHRIADNHGIYQANRMLERIRAMFNKGIEWGWEGLNPAVGIKKFREKSRDRFLLPEEVSRFFDALAQEENVTARDFILMALLTGARKGNVLAMQWKDISLQNEIWRIPDTKNGEPHNVPLSPQAMEILHKRKQIQELSDIKTPYVFPGEGKEGHFADPKKPWQRLREKSELHDLRLHDLRRTLGSWQALQGTSTAIIGKSLGHKSQQSTAVYERLTLEPVRQSVQNATEALFAAAKQNEDAA